MTMLFKMFADNDHDPGGNARVEAVSAGQIICREGQFPERIGLVLDGVLAMSQSLPAGRSNILGLLEAGDIYGRSVDTSAACQIRALTPGRICQIDRMTFERIRRQNPDVDRLLLANLLDEIDTAREWILLLGCHRVAERVASYLLILCRRRMRGLTGARAANHSPIRLTLAIRRSDLALCLGARVESLSRAFHELETRRAIRIIGAYEFEIMDLNKLIEIADHDLFNTP